MITQSENRVAWQTFPLDESLNRCICERIEALAQRLQEPSRVLGLADLAARRSRYSTRLSSVARLQSLALGAPGIALFFDELDRAWPAQGWDVQARLYRDLLPKEGSPEPECGLFSGSAGLFYMTHRLARGGGLAGSGTGQEDIWEQVIARLFPAIDAYDVPTSSPDPAAYDLATGAVGTGVVLLTLATSAINGTDQAQVTRLTQVERYLGNLVHHLTWLARRDQTKDVAAFAHWYSSDYLRDAQIRWQAHEHAYNGYGLRQGLAGLIAFLSLVLESDLDIDEGEVAEALQRLCDLLRQGIVRQEECWWPQSAPVDLYHRPGACPSLSWCSGSSGIARALWLAGRSLGESELCTLALECMAHTTKLFRRDPLRSGPSLCHGLAGLLQVGLRFVNETGDPVLREDMQATTLRLLELFEDERPFGYRTCEPEYIRVDSPWLLDGTPGIALALLSVVRTSPPDWDRVLLLS